MKNVQNLNQYLSNLSILVTKLHNLHWNVVGEQFMPVHKFTEELYEYYFDKFDSIAEILKMKGEMPLVKVADFLKHATIKEIDAKEFRPSEVLKIVKEDMQYMLEEARKIRAIALEEDDFVLSNELEDQIAYFTKQLWFIGSMVK